MKKNDYIVISVICFFLGIFIISQFYTGENYKRVIQPENNAVLAVEVAKLTKTNADLRREVQDLTTDLETYKNSSESRKKAYDLYINDSERFDIINGEKAATGQGIVLKIDGKMNLPQLVDLVNALKNIGGELIEINGTRIVLNSHLAPFTGHDKLEIKVLGNSNLLKTALERRGGIIEQISTKDIKFSVEEKDQLSIAAGSVIKYNFAKIIDDSKQ